jgi:predicted nucleic acid-binding protein
VKALDTPALLAILHDTPAGRELLKSLRGEEVGTTELQMFELRALIAAGSSGDRATRETALARLRRRISVLPITSEAVGESGRFLKSARHGTPFQALVFGALAAAGCSEWITTRAHAPPKGKYPFRLRTI